MSDYPSAPARLSADGVHWIVDRCPICGREHYHGAGGPGANHAEYLGHRVAHCGNGGGYVLVERRRTLPGCEHLDLLANGGTY